MANLILQKAILRKVRISGDCWEWQGALIGHGYGTLKSCGVKTTAHRASYIAWRGEIPDGLEIDHLCKNPRCVNPEHLEAVTHLENVRRGQPATQTQCEHGHEFTLGNTYIKANGCRSCRRCNSERQKTYRRLHPERYQQYEKNRSRR